MQRLLETLQQISRRIDEIRSQHEALHGSAKFTGLQVSRIFSREEELTGYISKIFEQQERERIVRWIVNSIRETLDLDKVLNTTVEEVGKLLKVDRSLLALFNKETQAFEAKSEFRIDNNIPSILGDELLINNSKECYYEMLIKQESIILNDTTYSPLANHETREFYRLHKTKSAIIVPIIHKGETLGAFSVHQVYKQRKWEANHIEILKDIGSQIAIAIRQAELYQMTKKQADRERLLRKIISTIRSTFDIDEILRIICEETAILFNIDRTIITEYPGENFKNWITRREYTVDESVKVSSKMNIDRRFGEYWGEMLFKGSTIAINNIYEYEAPNFSRETYEWIGGKSVLASPIKKGDKVWGSIVLIKINSCKNWTQEDIELLEAISDQVYLAIKQAELYQMTKKQAEREETLRKGITAIRSSLDIDEVINKICIEVAKIFNVHRVSIGRVEGDIINALLAEYTVKGSSKSFVNIEYAEEARKYWVKILNKANASVVFNDISLSDAPEHFKKTYELMEIKSIIGVPIKKGEKIWGGLFLSEYNHCKIWTEEEIDLLTAISDQVSIAITQASLYRQTQEATRLKGEFLANMSHEFRTPLNAIIGFSEMLLSNNHSLAEKEIRFLSNIAVSGKHLLRLVNDILDLSKIESGNMDLYYEKLDISVIIHESVTVLRNMAMEKNIYIDLQLVELIVNADPLRLKQIMYNLLSNAIKFTRNNGKITIRAYLELDNLKVEVEDTGIGISEDNKHKIFTRFRQLDSSYAREEQGTGLGLKLTKNLVELHKGSIGFESEENKGSKFWFTLPVDNNF